MYLASSRSTDVRTDEGRGRRGPRARGVAANVLAMGMVSLITDVSSEMVTAVLPLYLVFGLGLTTLQFGFLDGLYQAGSALMRLVGGHVADRWQRRKAVAGVGYGVSAAGKLGLLAVGSSVPAIAGVLALDRVGKGVRTAPRDALISLSSSPATLGRAFGVHRAMDTAGALLGPLVAFMLLSATVDAYDAVFVVSFCVATFGVVVLALFVRDRAQVILPRHAVALRATLALLGRRDFLAVCACATLLGLVAISDSFVYLLLQRQLDFAVKWFPLLPLGTASVFLLLAVPLGRLADRAGRWRVFLGGQLALLGVYLVLLGGVAGSTLLIVSLALHGTYYAATDGVLMALAGPMLPEHLRTSGLALVQTGSGLARMAASIFFGAAWLVWGARTSVTVMALSLGVALLVIAAFAYASSPTARPA